MATKFGRSKLLVTEILVLLVIIFIVGFGVGFMTARLKYKADLLETTLMANQNAKSASMVEELQKVVSLSGGALMTNDHTYLVKNGELELMKDSITLKDGSKVNVDGTVIRPTKDSFKLVNGQGIDVNGNLIVVLEQQ